MIRVEKSHLPAFAVTHPGMKGKVNEDRFAVTAFIQSEQNPAPSVLAVLSDGIGGHNAGEVASELAVNAICADIQASDGSQPAITLEQALTRASEQVYAASRANLDYGGMGATCAAAWVVGSRLYAASAGDSRIYLLRGGRILQLSTDHTWVQEALEMGVVTREEAVSHPNAHIIRRYLGSAEPPRVDLRLRLGENESDAEAEANQGMPLEPGDLLLLCSDGLSDLVKDDEIRGAFLKYGQQKACQKLLNLANTRGGHDNITLVSVMVPDGQTSSRSWPLAAMWLVGLMALAVIAGSVFAAWLWFDRNAGGQPGTPGQPLVSAPGTGLPSASAQAVSTAVPALAAPEAGSTPARPTLPPFQPAGGGPTLTPWPTHTLQPQPTEAAPPEATP
jgi:protein phosphatase